MDTVETKTAPKKGTKTTEAILGTAANKLNTAVKSIESYFGEIQKMPQTIDAYTLTITNLETKIESLTTEYKEKKRQFEVQLELDKKASIDEIVVTHLQSLSKTAVEISEYNRLKDELTKYKNDFEEQLAKEVGKSVGYAKANLENEKKLMEAMFNTKEADNKATIVSLNAQVVTLQKELADWKKALEEERKAGTERAKASAIGTVQVNGTGK